MIEFICVAIVWYLVRRRFLHDANYPPGQPDHDQRIHWHWRANDRP